MTTARPSAITTDHRRKTTLQPSDPFVAPSRSWEGYALGFLRARGVVNGADLARVQAAVAAWFDKHPPHEAVDPFVYADAVIDCLRLRPEIPIEGPIAFILQCLQPPISR